MSEFGPILEAISRIDRRLASIEARLDSMDVRLDRMDGRFAKLEGAAASTLDRVADLSGRVEAFPDMHYLSAAARTQLIRTREMMGTVAEVKVRMDEIYGAMATDSEIQNLRDEVAHFREESVANEVRLGTIEGHLGLTSRGP